MPQTRDSELKNYSVLWTFMSISKFYNIWLTLGHFGNMLTAFPTKDYAMLGTLFDTTMIVLILQRLFTYFWILQSKSCNLPWQDWCVHGDNWLQCIDQGIWQPRQRGNWQKILLEASSTFPLIDYKWKINITLYNANAAMTNYHHVNKVCSWCNNGFCKHVDQSCIFLLHCRHYQFIEGCKMEVPTIDPGEILFCKETHSKKRSL